MIKRLQSFFTVLKESKHPFRIIYGQLLVKTGLHRFFTIPQNGFKIHFSKSALAVTLFAQQDERKEDEEMLQRLLKPGQVYVDVGANIGTLTLAASGMVASNGKVIAIEAHPVTMQYLRDNVALNQFKNIEVIHTAAGNQQGELVFSSINSDDQNKVLLNKSGGVTVQVNTLDHVLASTSTIDLLKIDVEGYEKMVLEGATETLRKTTVLLYESWEKHFEGYGYQTQDVIRLLQTAGFTVGKAAGDRFELLSDHYSSLRCENLLAVKNKEAFCTAYGYTLIN